MSPFWALVVLVALVGPAPPSLVRIVGDGEHVELSVQDADLRRVLGELAAVGGYQLVLDPDVGGTVTAEFEGLPWDRALAAVLRTHGLAAEVDGRLWLGDRRLPRHRKGTGARPVLVVRD